MKTLLVCFLTGLAASTFLAFNGIYGMGVQTILALTVSVPFMIVLFGRENPTDG